MCTPTHFYICPTCFATTEIEPIRHPHTMICIDLEAIEPAGYCPPRHADGTLQTRRPVWFLAATAQARRQLQLVPCQA